MHLEVQEVGVLPIFYKYASTSDPDQPSTQNFVPHYPLLMVAGIHYS